MQNLFVRALAIFAALLILVLVVWAQFDSASVQRILNDAVITTGTVVGTMLAIAGGVYCLRRAFAPRRRNNH